MADVSASDYELRARELPALPIRKKLKVRLQAWVMLFGVPAFALLSIGASWLQTQTMMPVQVWATVGVSTGVGIASYGIVRYLYGFYDSATVNEDRVVFVPLTPSGLYVQDDKRVSVPVSEYKEVRVFEQGDRNGNYVVVQLTHPDRKKNVQVARISGWNMRKLRKSGGAESGVWDYAHNLATQLKLPLNDAKFKRR